MAEKTYYQPGTDIPERRKHPEFGVSEDRAHLLIREAIDSSLRFHEKEMLRQMDSRFTQLEGLIKSAFPDGDPDGHRRAHEAEIESANGWGKLKADLLSKIMTGGVWAGVVWLGVIVTEAMKQEVKK